LQRPQNQPQGLYQTQRLPSWSPKICCLHQIKVRRYCR
jgi:hypothetical protein